MNPELFASTTEQTLRHSAMVASGDTVGVVVVRPSGGLVQYTPSAARWLSDRDMLHLGDTWYASLPEPVRLRMHREWMINLLEGGANHHESASALIFCFENADSSRQVAVEFAVPVGESMESDLLIGTVRVAYLKPQSWVGGKGSEAHQSVPSVSHGRCIFAIAKAGDEADKQVSAMGVHCKLLANMSHEMQQPIYAVQNFMFAARQYLKMGKSEQVEQMLTKIERQVVRSREISDRLRQVAVGSKHGKRVCDIHQMIESCRDLAQMHANDARAVLHVDLQATRSGVFCDAAQVQEVILNLLRNAADSVASMDSADRSMAIETSSDRDQLSIRVIDSGVGIKPDVVQRMFDPFFTTKETGLGIGLTFCRSVVNDHGGELTLQENEPGRVVFRIELPLTP